MNITRHSLDSLLSTQRRDRKYVGLSTEILRDLSPDRERPDNIQTYLVQLNQA
jgi:hypothetical protein